MDNPQTQIPQGYDINRVIAALRDLTPAEIEELFLEVEKLRKMEQ